jgi:predicted nucleic acid-binding protein
VSLLDTNVLSAMASQNPPSAVVRWMDGRDSSTLFLSSVTIAEIALGIQALPQGRRRRSLTSRFQEVILGGFQDRVLAFDTEAAYAFGRITAQRRAIGRPIAIFDAQIAAIARIHRLRVATRNVRDFEDCGVELVNPFEA